MNEWNESLVRCIGCGREYKRADTVIVATAMDDGTPRRMCLKCAERGKKSLGGWRGMYEQDQKVLNEARSNMWAMHQQAGYVMDIDEEIVSDNLGWDANPLYEKNRR
jgi:hypothetical protein